MFRYSVDVMENVIGLQIGGSGKKKINSLLFVFFFNRKIFPKHTDINREYYFCS